MDSRLLLLIACAVFSQVFAADEQPAAAASLEAGAESNAAAYENSNADLLASSENQYGDAGVASLEEQSSDLTDSESHYRTARSPFFGGYGGYGGWGGYSGYGGYRGGYYGGYGGYGGYGYGYPRYGGYHGYHHYPHYHRGWHHRW